MKFRNPQTGKIYDFEGKDCFTSGFCTGIPCKACPIRRHQGKMSCREYVLNNPNTAASLMGYEVVEDEPVKSFSQAYQEYREKQDESLYLTECPECGSKKIEREPGTRHWTCHECGWESEPDRTAKADGGKPRPTLVPPSLMEAVAAVREYGCSKYHDQENWRRVEPQRYRDALYRHWRAYLKDPEACVPESGLPHLWP